MDWQPYSPKPPLAPRSGLIECRDCGREISRRATACPACGAPTAAAKRAAPPPAKKGNATGVGCGLIFTGLVVGIVFPPLGIFFAIVGFCAMVYGLIR